ncbi:MAG: helix-turn-helix domain-containing protein [Bacteroidaceae bacterium]
MVGTNTTYLSNYVNDYFGCNFRALINRYRIKHAKNLLNKGTTSIYEIPLACGFASKSAFYAVFKKEVGTTPMSYMREQKNIRNNKEEGGKK